MIPSAADSISGLIVLTHRLGHSLMIVPRAVAKEGYMDIQRDDYLEGKAEDAYFKGEQERQLKIIQDRWLYGVPTHIYKR